MAGRRCPLATNYQRGRAFEYRVRDYYLKQLDACYVMRAAQSKGIADLAAFFRDGSVDLIQCKRGKAKMSVEDIELLTSLARESQQTAVMALPGPGGRGVELTYLTEEGRI